MRRFLGLIILLGFYQVAIAAEFPLHTQYEVCFTPGGDCTHEIIDVLNAAHHSIEVQAYSLTAKPITKALVAAQQRGVKVRVILDAKTSNEDTYHRQTRDYLLKQKVPVWLDDHVNIAHNKVIIVDDATVITGSFNFTWSAQRVNAENVLIIHDVGLTRQYQNNWQKRLSKSTKIV